MIKMCVYFLLRSFLKEHFNGSPPQPPIFRGWGRAGILQRPRGRSSEW